MANDKPKTRLVAFRVTDAKGFQKRLRKRRNELKLSTRELEFEGCSNSYISRIETGERLPTLEIVMGLADRLGVSVSFLLTGEEASSLAEVAMQVVSEIRGGVEPPAELIDRLEALAIAASGE